MPTITLKQLCMQNEKKQNCWINSVLKSLQVILNTGRLNNRHLAFVLEKSKPDSQASIQYLTSQAYIYSIII